MAKTVAEMPAVQFSDEDLFTGTLPALQAQAAVEHGPIFKWPIDRGPHGGQEIIFMVGPEANRFVLHTQRDHFSHELGWTPVIGDDFGRGLLNMDDPDHARHRKMWNPAFTGAAMEAYLPVIQRVIAERARTWPEQVEVDVYQEAREITFDAAAAALAGFTRGPEVDHLRDLFYVMLHGFDWEHETWETFQAQQARVRGELTEMLLKLIHARRQAPQKESRDVLGMIVHARDEHGAPLSDEQVLAHLNILLIAGHETTTALGAWVMYLLATEVEQTRRVQAEVDAAVPEAGAPIPVEAIRSLKQLDNFIREAGRLHSPVINVPRGVVQDFEFGGYTVPAGMQMRLALAACHRLPHIFAEPERFDPDRLAPPREEDKRHQYSLVTFGGGPRICIGINFANIEVKALATHVLKSYRLEPVPEQNLVQGGFWTQQVPNGIKVRVYPREG
jgi:cytochrome P450